jgi:hypothetical protein
MFFLENDLNRPKLNDTEMPKSIIKASRPKLNDTEMPKSKIKSDKTKTQQH